MSVNYQYNYARIEADGYCSEVFSSTNAYNEPDLVEIPEYNEDYLEKYYSNGVWYEDAEFTIVWNPS